MYRLSIWIVTILFREFTVFPNGSSDLFVDGESLRAEVLCVCVDGSRDWFRRDFIHLRVDVFRVDVDRWRLSSGVSWVRHRRRRWVWRICRRGRGRHWSGFRVARVIRRGGTGVECRRRGARVWRVRCRVREGFGSKGWGVGTGVSRVRRGIGAGVRQERRGVGTRVSRVRRGVGTRVSRVRWGVGTGVSRVRRGVGPGVSRVRWGVGAEIRRVRRGVGTGVSRVWWRIGTGVGKVRRRVGARVRRRVGARVGSWDSTRIGRVGSRDSTRIGRVGFWT